MSDCFGFAHTASRPHAPSQTLNHIISRWLNEFGQSADFHLSEQFVPILKIFDIFHLLK